MAKQGTILVVDDNKAVLNALEMLLAGVFREVITIRTPNRIEAILESGRVDVVLLDMNFSAGINTGNEGLYWLSRIKEYAAEIPVVLFTAYADIDLAVRAVKEGATDFVVKPWDNAKLVATLLAAYRLHESRREVKQLKAKEEVLKGQLSSERTVVWGESDAMRRVRQLIEKVAVTDANVLITGENGTGKEIVAREIHALSGRKGEVMISVDMGAITETLFESELFGHVKGAFTDAREDRVGKFEAANKGTLFLDEIGELPLAVQAKLLRVLESGEIQKIAHRGRLHSDFRLIGVTNKNLAELVKNGQKLNFGQDFFVKFYQAFLYSDRWQQYIKGVGTTLLVTAIALVLGVVLGAIVAMVRVGYAQQKPHHRNPILGIFNAVAQVYVTVIRGTPMMVQLLIMSMVIFASSRNFTMVGALALGINSGAYVSEIIRGGLMAVDPGQMEAGRSLGLNYMTTMFEIIIPQAIRSILPALGNEFIMLLKDSSLITVIGGKELLYAAQGIMNRTYEPMFPLLGVAATYLVLVMLFSALLAKFERRLAQSDRR